MKIKQYALASILLLVAISLFVQFNMTDSIYTATIFSNELSLPISVWAIIPAALMFVASLAHMAFYSTVGFFRRYAIERDQKSLKKLIVHSLYGEESELALKHPQLTALGKLLANAQLVVNGKEISTGDVELDEIVNQVTRVKNGEFITFSSVIKPTKNSPVWTQNQLNRLKTDPKASESLLKDAEENTPFWHELLAVYSTIGDKKRILKTVSVIPPKVALNMLSRHKSSVNGIEFTIDEIVDIAKRAKFTEKNYIALAKALKTQINPDELLEIFYQLHSNPEIDQAQTAWIYVNLELERIDTVREIFDSSSEGEYLPFKYYLALKDAGMKPKLDEIIR